MNVNHLRPRHSFSILFGFLVFFFFIFFIESLIFKYNNFLCFLPIIPYKHSCTESIPKKKLIHCSIHEKGEFRAFIQYQLSITCPISVCGFYRNRKKKIPSTIIMTTTEHSHTCLFFLLLQYVEKIIQKNLLYWPYVRT